MLRSKPHIHLYIGGAAVAAAVLCLLILFLVSTRLDPLIQSMTLFFYVAAIIAMAAALRHPMKRQVETRESATPFNACDGSHEMADLSLDKQSTTAPGSRGPRHEERQSRSIILLTKQGQTEQTIRHHLAGWSHGFYIVNSFAEASQKLLNMAQQTDSGTRLTLIVDTRDLEIDPLHLPSLIKQETALSRLRLICILEELMHNRPRKFLHAGYNATLGNVSDKAALFSAINTLHDPSESSANVVNLASYRERLGQQARKRILLADQHTTDRKRIASLLQQAGHRVNLVENGEQALDALERQSFDVAIINLQLPIMNGTQVIKLHRFTTPHPEWVNFIVMTDQTTPATLRLCRDLQIKACLFKPVPTDALLEIVNTTPAITAPVPATVEHMANKTSVQQATRFLHAELLDIHVLQTLDQLDNDIGFVPDLIAIFGRDSIAILQGLEEAVECRDEERFIDLSNILLDNAGQLGAFALYETCLTLQQMSRRDLNSSLAIKLAGLRDLILRTNLAFQQYLREREAQRTDHS